MDDVTRDHTPPMRRRPGSLPLCVCRPSLDVANQTTPERGYAGIWEAVGQGSRAGAQVGPDPIYPPSRHVGMCLANLPLYGRSSSAEGWRLQGVGFGVSGGGNGVSATEGEEMKPSSGAGLRITPVLLDGDNQRRPLAIKSSTDGARVKPFEPCHAVGLCRSLIPPRRTTARPLRGSGHQSVGLFASSTAVGLGRENNPGARRPDAGRLPASTAPAAPLWGSGGEVQLPGWATGLSHLFWHLRMCRRSSKPSSRTWHRRIRTEKLRLLAEGVPLIEIHLVTRILRNPRNPKYALIYKTYLQHRAAGVSPWLSYPVKRDNLYYVNYSSSIGLRSGMRLDSHRPRFSSHTIEPGQSHKPASSHFTSIFTPNALFLITPEKNITPRVRAHARSLRRCARRR